LKNTQVLNFIEIRPAAAELFRADVQTDRQTEERMDRETWRI